VAIVEAGPYFDPGASRGTTTTIKNALYESPRRGANTVRPLWRVCIVPTGRFK